MKTLGIDIGTTTISVVVYQDGRVVQSRTQESRAFIRSDDSWEKTQDVSIILNIASGLVGELFDDSIDAIGLTGQQHGIVYVDSEGNAVSQLYTWQDGRGDLPYKDGLSYAEYASAATGRKVASGYGLVTHFYNAVNGLVPPRAAKICTIHDYLAMQLAGLKEPAVDASDAASFGFFDVRQGCFDYAAVQKLGLDIAILPKLVCRAVIGRFKGCPVSVAIGDNQASYMGSTDGNFGILVNVGTGSQFSVFSNSYIECPGLETRPFPLGGNLIVGAAICGGRAYALLDNFFCETVAMVTGERPAHCYAQTSAAIQALQSGTALPCFSPLFMGTRENPELRASLTELSADNFTPGAVAYALLQGMAGELYDMYQCYCKVGGGPRDLYGAGNGLRLNPWLRKAVEDKFDCQMTLSSCQEEAACGAALFAELVITVYK